MIVAFNTQQGLTCTGCLLNAHGALTVHRHHGVIVACDYRGQALKDDTTGTTIGPGGRPMVAVQATAVKKGQQCVQCGGVVKITRSIQTRIVHAVWARLSHHRASSRGGSRPIKPLRDAFGPHGRSLRPDPTSNRTSA